MATPASLPSVVDLLDGAVEMDAGFDVDDYVVGTGFGELGDVELGPLDHQVGLDGHGAEGANSLDDEGANGDVGDEMAVHDIYLNAARARLGGFLHLLTEACEVGGEYRWDYLDLAVSVVHRC